jgi:hypothetical protein
MLDTRSVLGEWDAVRMFNPGSCSEATTIVAIDGKGKATIYKQHSLVKEKLFAGAKIAVLMQSRVHMRSSH